MIKLAGGLFESFIINQQADQSITGIRLTQSIAEFSGIPAGCAIGFAGLIEITELLVQNAEHAVGVATHGRTNIRIGQIFLQHCSKVQRIGVSQRPERYLQRHHQRLGVRGGLLIGVEQLERLAPDLQRCLSFAQRELHRRQNSKPARMQRGIDRFERRPDLQ